MKKLAIIGLAVFVFCAFLMADHYLHLAWLRIADDGTFQMGDTANYTQLSPDGTLTMVGTARVRNHVRVTAPSWERGAEAPTDGLVGIFPVILFDSTHDDEAYYSIIVPFRLAVGTTIDVDVDWCYTGAQDNGTVCWNLDYITIVGGETVNDTTTTITTTTDGNHATGMLIRIRLTTGITGAIAHDILGLRLWRDFSEDTLGTDACLIQVHFAFIDDKLGEDLT